MQREDRLQQIVKLVGPDTLPESQRWILFIAELLKDGFLTQGAFDEKDMFCAPVRQVALLRLILGLHRRGVELLQQGVALETLRGLACVPRVMRAKAAFGNDELDGLAELERRVGEELDGLAKDGENGEKRT